MASLVKLPQSKYLVAAFRDSRGRQHRRSTRETDRKRAQRVADVYERVAKGKGNASRVRQTISEFFADHFHEDLPTASVRVYFTRWLAARKPELARATYLRYEKTIQRFLRHLGTGADHQLETVTRAHVAAFRDALAVRTSHSNANIALKVLKVAFRTARVDGYLLQDPAEGVKTFRNASSATYRRPFSLDELRAVLAVADAQWTSLIKFGIYTGQRLADIALLRWSQIDLKRNEIHFYVRKTKKRLLVPIAPSLREHLLSCRHRTDKPDAPVHKEACRIVTKQHGRVGTLSNAFADLLAQAGLREARTSASTGRGRGNRRRGMDLSFHSLRHSTVSLLKDAGIPDAVVMAIVGHQSAAMSHHYTHVGKEALQRATGSLPEI
jgi:integrase